MSVKYLIVSFIVCFAAVFSSAASPAEAQTSCSGGNSQTPVELAVPNLTGETLNVYWLDFQCVEQFYGVLQPDEIYYQSTFEGHEWIFRNNAGQEISRFAASSSSPMVLLGMAAFNPEPITTNCSRNAPNPAEGAGLRVINNTDDPALLFWIDDNCVEWLYWVVPAHNRVTQDGWAGHDWVVRWVDGRAIEHVTLAAPGNQIIIDPPQTPTPDAAAVPATAAPAATTAPVMATPVATTVSTAATGEFPVTESGCEVTAVTADMGVDPFYTKYCEYNGLRFLGSADADDAALEQAWLVAANMYFNRPDVVETLVEMGFFIVVMSEDQVTTDIPELAFLVNDTSADFNSFRGYSKVLEEPRLATIGEENLLCFATDTYAGENILVGRLATLLRFALVMDLDPGITDRLGAIRQNAIDNGLWFTPAWVTESNGSYWDYGVQSYFNSAPDALLSGPQDAVVNTRAELAAYDPQLFDLIDSVFEVDEWTPSCPTEAAPATPTAVPTEVAALPTEAATEVAAALPTEAPTEVAAAQPTEVTTVAPATEEAATFPVTESGCEVTAVTADMGVDPFYTKYCEYNGLRFLGSADADDAALEQAWLVAANMYFNRPDVVETLVEMGFFIVVMSEDQVTTDIPELAFLVNDTSADFNSFRGYSKVLEEPRLATIGEENLLCFATDTYAGENILVGRLATLLRFALVMDLDPGITDRLGAIRQNAIDNGLWFTPAWVTESNGSYWDYGVQSYFNSAPDALLSGPQDAVVNTRAELAAYDPQLFDLIDSVFQVDEWTPSCPAE